MDNVNVTVDGQVVFSDDAEGQSKMNLNGFVVSDGTEKKAHYYYLEWRNYAGSDNGLKQEKVQCIIQVLSFGMQMIVSKITGLGCIR